MGRQRTVAGIDSAVTRFAERLRDEMGAERVLLFGSRATGSARPDSDYDLIIFADSFRSVTKGVRLRKHPNNADQRGASRGDRPPAAHGRAPLMREGVEGFDDRGAPGIRFFSL